MEIKIVPADPRDVRGMQEVYYRTWLDTYPNTEAGITTDDIEDSYKDVFTEEALKKAEERIVNQPKEVIQLIAKDGDLVVGVCCLVKRDENYLLKTLYVLPEYQGKGIGGMLWSEVSKHKDNKDILVEVATYNNKAINFYKKLGFVDTGRRFTDERFRMKSGSIMPEMEMIIKAK